MDIKIDVPDLWGDLEPGQYAVGFKTLFEYDKTKPAIPYTDWDGKIYPTRETIGRHQKMPKRDDCFYILHNCPNRNIKNYINLQTFTLDVINRENTFPVNNSKCEYYNLKKRS